MSTPYYSDEWVTLYHGDCREITAWLDAGVLVTDPPYGIGLATNYAARKRTALAGCNDWGAGIAGDDEPFDPSPLLAASLPTVMFGANHYADRLPASPSWFVWDKLDGLTSKRDVGFNDQADVEMAWSNMGGPARIYRQRWMGAMKSGEDAGTRRRHPTEKPIELMVWVVGQCPPGTVADPFAGSGSTLVAAKRLGRKAIGVELEERYCEIAAKRLAQGVLDFGSSS